MSESDTFNWHEEPDDSFLKWFLPTVLGDCGRKIANKDAIAHLNETQPKWTENVKVTITVNGIDFDGLKFLRRVKEVYEHASDRKAQELAQLANLDEFDEFVSDLTKQLREAAENKLAAIGVELKKEEW